MMLALKKYIIVVLVASLFFVSPLFAQEQDRTVRDVMNNVSAQFVYAYFGKDALLFYVQPPEDDALIERASTEELNRLAAPFNSISSRFVITTLSYVYLATVAYFVFRFMAFLLENLWYAQRKGTSSVNENEFKSSIFKVIIFGGAAIAPWSFSTSEANVDKFIGIHNAAFMKLLGIAHQHSDETFSKLIQVNRPTMQTVPLPKGANKMADMMAVNNFFSCLRLDHSRQQIGTPSAHSKSVEFYYDPNGTLSGAVSEGQCSLTLSVGVDTNMVALAEVLSSSNPSISIDPESISSSQLKAIKGVIERAMNQGLSNSAILSLPTRPEQPLTESNWGEQLALRPYTSIVQSEQRLERWEAACPTILSMNWNSSLISERDRSLFHLLSARCGSLSLTQSLLYPPNIPEIDKFLASGPLKDRNIPVCVDSSTLALLKSERYTPRYSTLKDTEIESHETVALEQCLIKNCSESFIGGGGLYACANSISQLSARELELQASERGIFTSGLYMFRLFTHQESGATARQVYNGIRFSFSQSLASVPSNLEKAFTLNISLPAVSENHQNKIDDTLSTLGNAMSSEERVLIEPVIISNNWLDDMLGQSRLMSCVKSPMQMTEGYACGNIPQEFNRFGMNMLRAVIAMKTLLVVGDAVKKTGNVLAEESGSMGSKAIVMKPVMALATWLGASFYAETVIDGVLNAGFSLTDDFGFWDQTQTRKWMDNSTLLTSAMAVGVSSAASSVEMIDSLLLLGLIIGIVFAFFVPLFPLLLVLSSMSMLFFLIASRLCMTGFLLVDCAFERKSEKFLGEAFDKLWSSWMAALLKMPLMLIGLFLAWLMSNVIIAHVLRRIDFKLITNDGMPGFLDTMVLMLVSLIVVYIVYNTVMTIIESFYDFTVEWLTGSMSGSPYSDRRGFGMKDSKEVFNVLLGK